MELIRNYYLARYCTEELLKQLNQYEKRLKHY